MTTEQIATMLSTVGIPTAYYQFPDTLEGPPFLCFYFQSDNDVKADNLNYVQINHLIVELYTDTKDYDLESTLESALKASGMVWSKSEEYLDDEHMNEVTYEMDVIITEENNA